MIRPLPFNHTVGCIDAFTTERGAADCLLPYSEVNCCSYTGDTPEHVASCRKRLYQAIATESVVTARQTHSANVAVIRDSAQEPLENVDALVTKLTDVAVGVFTADCVPILLCDPASGVIAAVHAGWKGTVKGIVTNAVDVMAQEGAQRSRIEAVIGPSICQQCFEVCNEVVAEFARQAFSLNDIVWQNPVTGKAHINLAEANRQMLALAGVPYANIALSGLCTKCNPQRFFSARALGIQSGRILTGIIRRHRH